MASVTTNKITGDSYTWATSPFSWNSQTSYRTWGETYKILFNSSITEDTINFLENNLKFNFAKKSKEALVISELLKNSPLKSFYETFNVADTYSDNINFIFRVLETISFLEKNPKTLIMPKLGVENFSVSEGNTTKTIEKNNKEYITLVDSVVKNQSFLLNDILKIEGGLSNNYALYFNQDGYITINNPISTSLNWAVEAYVKISPANNQYLCDYNVCKLTSDSYKPLLYLTNANNEEYVYGDANLQDNIWHHVIFSCSSLPSELKIYVDGINVSGEKVDLGTHTPSGIPSTITIGSGLNGAVTGLRFYDKGFNDAEALERYSGGEILKGYLVGMYNFTEGAGQVLQDFSGKANHGSISGGTWIPVYLNNLSKEIIMPIEEFFALQDYYLKALELIQKDVITINDTLKNSYIRRINDAIGFAEKYSNNPNKINNDSFSITDSRPSFDLDKVSKESIQFIEFYFDLTTFMLVVAELVHFTEQNPKEITIPKLGVESFGISDKESNSAIKEGLESLNVNDTVANNESKVLSEILNTSDLNLNEVVKSVGEVLIIKDNKKPELQFVKAVQEYFSTMENYSNVVDFNAKFIETINMIEILAKDYNLSNKEAIGILESWLRHANNVISDLFIMNEEMTENNLDSTLSPVGYSAWKLFQTGDYTYKDALMKVVLGAGVNSDRPNVAGWTMNVDVPDTSDSGQTHILPTNQPLFVPFNRTFHVVPEVIVQVKSGATSNTYMNIVSITSTGFTVELRDNGVYSDGWISWSAKGY